MQGCLLTWLIDTARYSSTTLGLLSVVQAMRAADISTTQVDVTLHLDEALLPGQTKHLPACGAGHLSFTAKVVSGSDRIAKLTVGFDDTAAMYERLQHAVTSFNGECSRSPLLQDEGSATFESTFEDVSAAYEAQMVRVLRIFFLPAGAKLQVKAAGLWGGQWCEVPVHDWLPGAGTLAAPAAAPAADAAMNAAPLPAASTGGP